jgi:hypothetical protein
MFGLSRCDAGSFGDPFSSILNLIQTIPAFDLSCRYNRRPDRVPYWVPPPQKVQPMGFDANERFAFYAMGWRTLCA